jgi:predicted GNAT family acetyltransferase
MAKVSCSTFQPRTVGCLQQRFGVDVGSLTINSVDCDIHITHTEIDPSQWSAGLASEMVWCVLDARTNADTDYRVVADCPNAVIWLSRHPEYHMLAAARLRAPRHGTAPPRCQGLCEGEQALTLTGGNNPTPLGIWSREPMSP